MPNYFVVSVSGVIVVGQGEWAACGGAKADDVLTWLTAGHGAFTSVVSHRHRNLRIIRNEWLSNSPKVYLFIYYTVYTNVKSFTVTVKHFHATVS